MYDFLIFNYLLFFNFIKEIKIFDLFPLNNQHYLTKFINNKFNLVMLIDIMLLLFK